MARVKSGPVSDWTPNRVRNRKMRTLWDAGHSLRPVHPIAFAPDASNGTTESRPPSETRNRAGPRRRADARRLISFRKEPTPTRAAPMPFNPRVFFRKTHRWGAILVAVPFLLVLVSGLLLQVK